MEDSQIVKLFFERSEDAIAELSQKYGKSCMNIAMNVLHDREDAEECVNDAYLKVWNEVPPAEPEYLGSFTYRIVRCLAVNRYYQRKTDREKGNYDLCIEEFEELIQTEEETDDSLEAEALSKAVECFVNGLKETNRMIFVRRFWYLDDYRSLAEKTGMNETAVRKRVSRMKADLMEYLKKKGMMI